MIPSGHDKKRLYIYIDVYSWCFDSAMDHHHGDG
jgi:hypothetical protein